MQREKGMQEQGCNIQGVQRRRRCNVGVRANIGAEGYAGARGKWVMRGQGGDSEDRG